MLIDELHAHYRDLVIRRNGLLTEYSEERHPLKRAVWLAEMSKLSHEIARTWDKILEREPWRKR